MILESSRISTDEKRLAPFWEAGALPEVNPPELPDPPPPAMTRLPPPFGVGGGVVLDHD